MAFTLSPNMNLPVPNVGTEPGPDYALDVNNALAILDQHTHAPGSGVQINPSGININSALTFNNNYATQVAGLTLTAQSTLPGLGTLYEAGTDLYFIDGIGNNVRITQAGGIAGAPGSITNLTPPASVTYVSGSQTFVFQSDFDTAANIDVGAVLFRNLTPNSTNAITLMAPPSLTSNSSLTLPLTPAVQSFMTLDAAGVISAPWTVDDSTIKIISNQLVVQGNNIPSSAREHAWELNGPYNSLAMPLLNVDAIFIAPYNINITAVWIYNGTAGSSGTTVFDLKTKVPGGGYSSILSTTGKITSAAAGDIYTDSNAIISPQAGVVKPVVSTPIIAGGSAIRFDLLQSMGGIPADARIRIFYTQL